MSEIAPTGTLRVAIALAPAPSAQFAIKGADGRPRGVAVDLGTALARSAGVPVAFVVHASSGEIVNAAASDTWDVAFLPVDDERRKSVDFGAAYHLLQSTYLVAPASAIRSLDGVNRAGVRIGGIGNTATFRAAKRTAPDATPIEFTSVEAALVALQEGALDAIAFSRETLGGLLDRLAGARILDGGFLNSTTAIALPKGRPQAVAQATAFIEQAKASGLVRQAFDDMGLVNSAVAPPGIMG